MGVFPSARTSLSLGVAGLAAVTTTFFLSPSRVTPDVFAPQTQTQQPPVAEVYFSPKGGCTKAIVTQIEQAERSVLVQAYSFTSAPIAKALVAAHQRGVTVV